jgi:flagellar biosynthesis/type III secretory pathway protein FliH
MCNLSEGLVREGMAKGRAVGLKEGRAVGIEEGMVKGRTVGENKLAELINRLLADNRQEDIARVTSDEEVRRKMYEEYGIVD